ncbi:MAG: Type and secretion system protein [Chthoniobacteraceae bacterium]|nr:Type and secretion system protein [Chthoniobacteraceae bacterium]
MNQLLLLLLFFAVSAHAQLSPGVSRLYDFQDDDISVALRALALQGNIKLIIASEISGKVTLRVDDKTPCEVFDMIAATKHLVINERDGILYVSSAPFIISPIVFGLLALAFFLSGWRVMLPGSGTGLRALGMLLTLLGVLCVILSFAFARGWFSPAFASLTSNAPNPEILFRRSPE